MITITGGKLTTWRRMAKMTVDRIVDRDNADAPCRTHEIPLGYAIPADDLPRIEGVPEDAYEALAGRYGHAAHDVLRVASERGELAQPIVPGLPDLLAEAAHAARKEQVTSVGDVLFRRTRLALLAARDLDEDPQLVRRVAEAVGRELGWDEDRIAAEVASFGEEAVAEGILVAQ
jgi:glycerol-3-phosphate dehydrogenase